MAIMFSGGPGVTDAMLELGIKPEYAMGQWLGPWTNQAQIDNHIAYCKARGVKPAFQFFYWGDEICLEVLKGTYAPKEYGGKSESIGEYWALAKLLTDRLKATGTVGALVSIESEWNKRGPNVPEYLRSVTAEPAVWDQIFADTAGLFHSAPGTKVVTCPGQWSNLATLLTQFPKMVASCDYVATQGLNTLFNRSEASYIAGTDSFLRKVEELKVGGKGKPVYIMDTAWSSYSGSYGPKAANPATGYPGHYAPIPPATAESNLRAGEAAQAKAIARLGELLPRLEAAGLRGIFYRGLKDSRMNVANYWGYFEWGWGVVRLDGTEKPSYDALMALANPATAPVPVPAPEMYTQAEMDKVQASVRDLQQSNLRLMEETRAAVTKAATLQTFVDRIKAVVAEAPT